MNKDRVFRFVTCIYRRMRGDFLVFGRNYKGRRHFEIYGFEPYFYVPKRDEHLIPLKDPKIKRIEKGKIHITTALKEVPTIKIIVYNPSFVPDIRDMKDARGNRVFKEHYEADIPFTRRFLIDRGIVDHFVVTRLAKRIQWDEIGVTKSLFDEDFQKIIANSGWKRY